MKSSSIEILACPICHHALQLQRESDTRIEKGILECGQCGSSYPIQHGIPQFIQANTLLGYNRRFSHLYDWFSWVYRPFSRAAFAYIGMEEEEGRREITDRLEPYGGRVLEVSIGPGVNLPYLVGRPDVGEVYGVDISPGQLQRCQALTRKKGWQVDLFLGNAEQLPFRYDVFDGVFHVGGINFFNDQKAAIDEMIRVARPGAKILIADETEKGASGYEKILPGFKKSFAGKRPPVVPPIHLVPQEMLETRLFEVWKGWLYCIEFRKPLDSNAPADEGK
jgi:ubiquinone/menaquinone biosynthesis C-methylase UbiE/uncharacterized protein YbaR (Trm112 family)